MCHSYGHATKEERLDPTEIYVNFRWLNKVTLTDPFLTPFTNEIINEVTGHECYSFTDNFSGYNQVHIEKEDQYKTNFFV